MKKGDKKRINAEADAIYACMAARSSVCECYFNGCDDEHFDMIDRLYDPLEGCYDKL